jgi:hypothetical protein
VGVVPKVGKALSVTNGHVDSTDIQGHLATSQATMNHRLAISRAVRTSARAGPSRWSLVARCYATTNEDKLTVSTDRCGRMLTTPD